jgi:hypothetical protein
MNLETRITHNPLQCGGKPCIRGMRIRVSDILQMLGEGVSYIYWVDAQLPPQLANWVGQTFQVEAYALRDLHLRDAEDGEIFQQARQKGIVIISKDSDFVEMILRLGTPPQLLWK